MKKALLIPFLLLMTLFCPLNGAAQTPDQQLCEGVTEQYSVTNNPGNTYDWQILEPGFAGTITGNPTHQIVIDWGNTPVGTYTLQVIETNADGCEGLPVDITIEILEAPAPPILSVTQPACGDNGGTITVTNTDTGLEYSIDGGATWQTTGAFTDMAPGDYTIMVQNANGCDTESAQVTVNPLLVTPDAPVIVNTVHPGCGETTGSFEVQDENDPDLTYSLDGGAYTTNLNYTHLAPGDYDLTVQNADGCETTITVTINPAPIVPADAVSTVIQPDCGETTGSITVNTPTGANIEYSIDGGVTWQSSPLFTGLTPGNYDVIVRDTSANCESTPIAETINASPTAPVTSPISFN
ncbi:hypothetical protein [Mesonia sp. K7]|uniref:hypothetical protein n=1 Tax=Mesonia sp. K7 TaxID=2218606 RepID=UPI000DAA3343|nr:hypothetical protein [Mesonia sp. K7]PZD77129.1 hypothetical protein DNG35_09805 [Mesonia sp. K7]